MFLGTNQENNSNEVLVNDGSLENLLDVSLLKEKEKNYALRPEEGQILTKLDKELKALDWDRMMIVGRMAMKTIFNHLKESSNYHPLWGTLQALTDSCMNVIMLLLEHNEYELLWITKSEYQSVKAKLDNYSKNRELIEENNLLKERLNRIKEML